MDASLTPESLLRENITKGANMKNHEPQFTEFCNHVCLGQWELATASAKVFINSPGPSQNAKETIAFILKCIAAHPEKSCMSFTEVSSPANLSWQCCQLLEDICGKHEDVIDLKKDAEFRLLLQETMPHTPSQILQQIYDTAATPTVTSPVNLVFSNECIRAMQMSLLESPLPTHYLLSYIVNNIKRNSKPIKEQIHRLYLHCLQYLVKELGDDSTSETRQTAVIDKLLLFLSIMPDDVANDRRSTQWDDFVHGLLDLTNTDVIETKQVYGALLGRRTPYLICHYCKMEDKAYRRGEAGDPTSMPVTLFLENHAGDSSSSLNFRELILCSVKQRTHFLETILDETVHCLHAGHDQAAWALLRNPFLSELRPLSLMLAFESGLCNGNTDKVMQAMELSIPSTLSGDPSLLSLVYKLKYYICVTKWCLEMLQNQHPNHVLDLKHKAKSIITSLRNESPLRVVHGVIGHHNISEEDMLHLLSDKMLEGLGFPEPLSTIQRSILQNNMTYRGCLAVQYVMEAIKCSHELEVECSKNEFQELVLVEDPLHSSEKTWMCKTKTKRSKSGKDFKSRYAALVTQKLEQAKALLDQIYPIRFRIEILEDIFSLLFVTVADVQNANGRTEEDYEGDCTVGDASSPESNGINRLLYRKVDLSSSSSGSSTALAYGSGDSNFVLEKTSKASNPLDSGKDKPGKIKTTCRHHFSSASGSDSSKSSTVPKFEFLCTEQIVQDILGCIEAATISTNVLYGIINGYISDLEKNLELPQDKMAEVEKELTFRKLITSSVSDESLRARLSSLLHHIGDAQWRFQVVKASGAECKVEKQSILNSKIVDGRNTEIMLSDTDETTDSEEGYSTSTAKHVHSSPEFKEGHAKEIQHLPIPREPRYGMIPQMLASPTGLLRFSLIQGKLEQAEQVKKLYNLKDDPDVKELAFASSVSSTVSRLNEVAQFKTRFNSGPVHEEVGDLKQISVPPDVAAVAEAAAVGKEVTKVGALVGNLLSSTQISTIPEIEQFSVDYHSPTKHPLLEEGRNVRPLVLADLAYTSELDEVISVMLLDMALQHIPTENISEETSRGGIYQRRNSLSNARGMFRTVLQIRYLVSEVAALQKASDDKNYLELFPTFANGCRLPSILSSPDMIFDMTFFKETVLGWQKFITLLKELRDMVSLKNDSLTSDRKNSLKTLTNLESRNQIHLEYLKLRRMCLDELRIPLSSFSGCLEGPQYMKALYKHVQRVCTALLHCRTQCSSTASPRIVYTSYFSVLEDDPSEVLATLILKEGVSPKSLENFAKEMKVNLLDVIIKASCPFIPCHQLMSGKDTAQEAVAKPPISKPIVLNFSSTPWNFPRHPVIVAQELASNLLNLMQKAMISRNTKLFDVDAAVCLSKEQEWAEWTASCSELEYVDLTLLHSNHDKLAFFANLSNVMLVHALVLEVADAELQQIMDKPKPVSRRIDKSNSKLHLLSPYICRRLTRMKLVGYHVGQLGFLSIYDLKYVLLRYGRSCPLRMLDGAMKSISDADSKDFAAFAPNPDPRLHFMMTDGFVGSPPLQVLFVESLTTQIEKSTVDFLMHHVKADVLNRTIILPELLSSFSEDFVIEEYHNVNINAFEGLVNWIASNIDGMLKEDVLEILNNSSMNCETSDDTTVEMQEAFTVQFLPSSNVFGITLDAKVQDEGFLVMANSISHAGDNHALCLHEDVVEYLKSKSWILVDFMKLLKAGEFQDSQPEPESSLTECITDSDPISRLVSWVLKLKDHLITDSSASDAKWIIHMLSPSFHDEYPWHVFDLSIDEKLYYPTLEMLSYMMLANRNGGISDDAMILRECLLCYLAAGDVHPWTFALCINNVNLKVDCILNNLPKWSDDICVKVLQACISEVSVMNRPNLVEKLKRKLKEINVCQKILQAKNKNSALVGELYDLESWKDVALESSTNPYRILHLLKKTRQLQLSIEWAGLYPVPEDCDILVKEMELLFFLEQEPLKKEEITQVLLSIFDTTKCAHLCNNLITQTKSLHSKLFLLEHLRKHCPEVILEVIPEHEKLELGIRMMLAVPESVRHLYEPLILHPEILFEQLLMNMEIKAAEYIVKSIIVSSENHELFSIEMVDKLLEQYARKSIELPLVPDVPESLTSSIEFVNTMSFEQTTMPPVVPKREEWVPDNKVSVCMVCNVEQFSMFCRRHHCRRCGRVVCASCSGNTLVLEEYGNVPVRACKDCFQQTHSRRLSEILPTSPMPSSSPDKRKQLQRYVGQPSSQTSNERATNDGGSSRTSISADKLSLYQWILSTDVQQNANVVNDFYYEQAPSISLCLSLLHLHSNMLTAAKCMLDFCDILMNSLKPKSPGKPNKEVDYGLVISMMRTLLLNAKMRFELMEDVEGSSRTDVYLKHLDLINTLVASNCKDLIPIGDLSNTKTVRKLRDRLVEEERYTLALEVSTKWGLDTAVVYQQWGMVCLQAGCWKLAREKFSYCLQKSKDVKQAKGTSRLLEEILHCIENSKCRGGVKAAEIYQQLSNVRSIRTGIIQMQVKKDDLDPFILMECLHYLKTYGNQFAIVAFYHRHKMITEALQYIINEGCVPDVFVESLLLPSLECGQISNLLSHIRQLDPALVQWKFYLMAACRYLHRHRFRHVLYKIQVFMEDYLRAAMSCIQFFTDSAKTYNELNDKIHYLHTAVYHYREYLKRHGHLNASAAQTQSIMIQSNSDVERLMNIALLQVTVTKVLNKPSASKVLPLLHWNPELEDDDEEEKAKDNQEGRKKLSSLPTLFDGTAEKIKLAAIVALCENAIDDGLPLTKKIIQVAHLDDADVYCLIAKMLVHSGRREEIPHFLSYIQNKEKIDSPAYDSIITKCIRNILSKQGKPEEVESLVKMMHSDSCKIDGYLQCGKLRAAYLLAMQIESVADVKKIMAMAESMGQEAVRKICEKWLQNKTRMQHSQH